MTTITVMIPLLAAWFCKIKWLSFSFLKIMPLYSLKTQCVHYFTWIFSFKQQYTPLHAGKVICE